MERRYWLSSADFYEMYNQGLLDDGEHTEDFALWAGFYEIKLDREQDLHRLSQARMQQLRLGAIKITPPEPILEAVSA